MKNVSRELRSLVSGVRRTCLFVRHSRLFIQVLCVAFFLSLSTIATGQLSTDKDGYQLSVQVVPRLGAFNKIIFEEAFDSNCQDKPAARRVRSDWREYSRRLVGENPKLLEFLSAASPQTAVGASFNLPQWDILVTQTPELQGEQGKPRNCGYGARKVFVEVKSLANGNKALSGCEFRIDGMSLNENPVAGPCSRYFFLNSNLAAQLDVTIREPGRPNPVKLNGMIPEDFLIVSLGDSYASGEGNPDVPKSTGNSVLWMDAWCHRSAFAGPIQSGLRLLERSDEVQNQKYRAALKARAVTIVSFACSGGWVSKGLNGEYSGAIDWSDFVKNHASGTVHSGGPPSILRQVLQLAKLLSSQKADWPVKDSVDLLLLSGGGNDLLFAPVVQKVVLQDISSKQKQQELKTELEPAMREVSAQYRQFAQNLATQKFNHPGTGADLNIRYSGVQITRYPDPTYENASSECTGSIEQKSEGLLADIAKLGTRLFNVLMLTEAENDFVRKEVLAPLNAMISSTEHGWYAIDLSAVGTNDVRQHGWCKAGNPGYQEQERWFRQPTDSLNTQGTLHGTFHPTSVVSQRFHERRL